MDFLPEEFEEILNIFRGETEEIIQKMNNNLLQLENTPDNKDLLVYLFRDAHSLKGAARMIGFNNIQRLAHKTEDVLGLAKENKIEINREISDALYKATDLLSDLIQESVKLKREYYTDNIQKQIDSIDGLIAKYQKTPETPKEPEKTTQLPKQTDKKKEETELEKTFVTINALLSEAYLLLKNMKGEEGSSYLETFEDVIKQLNEKFEPTTYYDIKNELKNIEEKMSFVILNSNIMTDDEISDIDDKLLNIVHSLNKIYQEEGLEKFDLKEKVAQKIDAEKNTDGTKTEPVPDAQNSLIKNFVEKMEFVKDGLSKLENNLTQIPALHDALDIIIEISQKQEVTDISHKIEEILDLVKNSNTLPEKEIISILKQSLSSVEQMTLDTKDEKEDISLVLQRLDIIKQMLDINRTVNPLSNISATLDESSLPVKKAQDFFNSFETTSIKTLRVDSKKLDRLVNQMGELIIGRIKHKKNISEILPKTTDSPMHPGDIMEIKYGPDRVLHLEYRGNVDYNFRVVQTINTKFEYGDLVHVPFIRENQPLSGWVIMRNNRIIGQYNSADNHLVNKKRIIPLKKDS